MNRLAEQLARQVARHSSRRGFLGRLGFLLTGAGGLPLLPIARAAEVDSGDPESCDYWRYCGTHGPLCACCGGSANACPPGTQMSVMGWIGTCQNPTDGKSYIISYNDCCGKPLCGRCWCDRATGNPRNLPPVRPQASGDILWCIGTKETYPTCTTANVVGVALDQG
jgi:methylamine dehydrogenase light chain